MPKARTTPPVLGSPRPTLFGCRSAVHADRRGRLIQQLWPLRVVDARAWQTLPHNRVNVREQRLSMDEVARLARTLGAFVAPMAGLAMDGARSASQHLVSDVTSLEWQR